MPAVAGHELPTPGNADSPKQKKHREQAIVIGTLVLVILTFVLVQRRGTNSQPVLSDPNSYQPDTSGGGSFGDPNAGLQNEIGALPGQIAALDQGKIAGEQKRNVQQTARLNAQAKKIKQQAARLRRLGKQENKLAGQVQRLQQHPMSHGHPKGPAHPIHVTAHGKAPHPLDHWSSKAVHPPTHTGKKSTHIPFGAIPYQQAR